CARWVYYDSTGFAYW
nr:immunoglobulin heavy chain junction region [Mus musculus]